MPSAAHFIYIPIILLLGIVVGWVLGAIWNWLHAT